MSKYSYRNRICYPGLLLALVCSCAALAAKDIDLPILGDSSAGLMSPAEEHALGQAWLRSFRASVPLQQDPVVFEYVENLLLRLASDSELEDRRLDLVVVDNPTINAFAVPGGVVGVHTGLILHADTEAQFASVLTHELAHLSQRHFARSVEAAKRTNITSIAGLLAGIILASTTGSDAGTALIASSQAAALDSRLRYSRIHEREADRIGMKTLAASGYNARAAADMFKQMQDASRLYGNEIPEFLRTHPVTESRIADAENRAREHPQQGIQDDIDYQLIRTRVRVHSQNDPARSIKHYKFLLDNVAQNTDGDNTPNRLTATKQQLDAARYGLALAYNQDGQWRKARSVLAPLLKQMPGRIPYSLLDIEIDLTAKQYKLAEKRLRDFYALTPNNYAISMLLAKTLMKNKNPEAATHVLSQLTKFRPKQADVWYLLAETQGLSGDILNLHLARAEFFLLRGNFAQTRQHLHYALKIAGDHFQTSARIKQRLQDVQDIQKMLAKL